MRYNFLNSVCRLAAGGKFFCVREVFSLEVTLTPIMCLLVVLVFMSIGDIVSMKTKAFVPSVFVAAVLFLAGYWGGWLPKDVVDRAQMGAPIATLSMYLLITHMGTMMSVRELCREWKTVVIAVAGLAGMALLLWYVGPLFTDRNAIVTGTPPLSGGVVAAIIMGKAAGDLGMKDMAVMAMLIYIVQGFVGYPLTALCLKSEGKRLLKLRADGRAETARSDVDTATGSGFHLVPLKYQTTYTHIACVALVASLADLSSIGLKSFLAYLNPEWVRYALHPLVICLIFGAIAAELGIVERRPMNKAGAMGYLITILMVFIMGMLNSATPEMLPQLVRPIAAVVVVGVVGLLVASCIVGAVLGYTLPMSMALSLTALYGFPPNYVLTDEASKALAGGDEDTYNFLMSHMLPRMLTGGFITVTITSVILAGIYSSLLVPPAGM